MHGRINGRVDKGLAGLGATTVRLRFGQCWLATNRDRGDGDWGTPWRRYRRAGRQRARLTDSARRARRASSVGPKAGKLTTSQSRASIRSREPAGRGRSNGQDRNRKRRGRTGTGREGAGHGEGGRRPWSAARAAWARLAAGCAHQAAVLLGWGLRGQRRPEGTVAGAALADLPTREPAATVAESCRPRVADGLHVGDGMLSSGTRARPKRSAAGLDVRTHGFTTRRHSTATLERTVHGPGTNERAHVHMQPCSRDPAAPQRLVVSPSTGVPTAKKKKKRACGSVGRGAWRAAGRARPRAFIAAPASAEPLCRSFDPRGQPGAPPAARRQRLRLCLRAAPHTHTLHTDLLLPPGGDASACCPHARLPAAQSRTCWLHHCSTTTSHSRPTAATTTTTTSTHVRIPLHSKLHRCSRFRFLRPGISRSRPANKRADRRLSSILDHL